MLVSGWSGRAVCVGLVLLFVFAGGLSSGARLWAQETNGGEDQAAGQVGIDDLFSQPDSSTDDETGAGDAEAETDEEEKPDGGAQDSTDESGGAVDLDALTTSPVKFSGKVSAGVGAGAGIGRWPGESGAEGQSVRDLMRYSGFYNTTATFSVDARPEPYLRFYSSFEVSLDDDNMTFNGPSVKEVFIDYTLDDTVFFRAGRQALTWGQGRLLSNPANLVDRVSDGVALRCTAPAGPGTLSGVVYSKDSWINAEFAKYNPKAFGYAGQYEFSAGPLDLGLLGHFKMKDDAYEDIGAAATASFAVGPFDMAADFTGHWARPGEPGVVVGLEAWQPADWQALGRLFWENDERSWSLLGEYEFDSTVAAWRGHYGALALRMPKLGGSSWRPALRWKHAFQDNSGEVLAGLDGTIAPKLKMSIGVPLIYGAPDTYYREALTEQVDGDNDGIEEEENLIPVDNVVSLLLTIRLSFSF